ncbi:MAG: hypothetical protein ABI584_01545 [Acidobacteriota bacterium]
MPRPIGRDRIADAREGRILLACAEPKGWRARSQGGPTAAEHPGTCVRWEEQLFEVESLEIRADGSHLYTLAIWDERHAIRVLAAYDDRTEAERVNERRAAARRVEGRTALLLAAPLAGHLPAAVQERLEKEYNVPGWVLTLASAVPLWIFGWTCLILLFASSLGGGASLPTPVLFLGVYFLAESSARLSVCIPQSRPIGTPLGALLYEVWRRVGKSPV